MHLRSDDEWDLVLSQIMRFVCTIPHSNTDEIANYLMLGRESKLLDQLVSGGLEPEHESRKAYIVQLL